jgi:hypothetical protein
MIKNDVFRLPQLLSTIHIYKLEKNEYKKKAAAEPSSQKDAKNFFYIYKKKKKIFVGLTVIKRIKYPRTPTFQALSRRKKTPPFY